MRTSVGLAELPDEHGDGNALDRVSARNRALDLDSDSRRPKDQSELPEPRSIAGTATGSANGTVRVSHSQASLRSGSARSEAL
jgi:hypothetical protein